VIYLGDDYLDLFFFFGTPKEILSEYTALTGRAKMMPLWSFGLWIGRDTYSSEDEVRDVAKNLRQYEIPCDVVHIDTGWFETPHRCDFEFSKTRFPDPAKMISDLEDQRLHLSLWQLPYFNPKNRLHDEVIDRGYVVLSANGKPPIDDAVLDFSNEEAESWYQQKLRRLLEMGVGAIVADFGEAAPLAGLYAHREGAFYEHNLYPLRYNKAIADISREVSEESVMWARSAWAGCQRYPLHWGGDPENTDGGLAGTLRGGLSLGLCGFSFWSHFIGGFPHESPEGLYGRWLAFGVFSSHSRCHGRTPREPWEFGEEFTDEFRRTVELRYRLMPYVYAQAKLCSEEGYPMMRTLFFDYPEDGASWFVEDEYMFGRDLLVAPLMEDAPARDVYLPPGRWIDYQSGKAYQGAGWHRIGAGEVPLVLLAKDGAAIPHIKLAQSTSEMDWREIELVIFSVETSAAEGLLCLPEEGQLHALRVERKGEENDFVFTEDPLQRRVDWRLRTGLSES
jgi:alpha-D-xyloside xylohydrolase